MKIVNNVCRFVTANRVMKDSQNLGETETVLFSPFRQ